MDKQATKPLKNTQTEKTLERLFASGSISTLMLVGLYIISVALWRPEFSARPYSLLIHVLLLLGVGVVFFSISDLISIAGLRRLLRRDYRPLLSRYGARQSLANLVDQDEFSSLDTPKSRLGGGLVYSALRSSRVSENPSPESFLAFLSYQLSACALGKRYLRFAAKSATLVGLLGTVVGLKATFENASSATMSGPALLGDLFPYLSIALVTTMLGITFAVIALLSVDLVTPSIEHDCQRLLAPVCSAIAAAIPLPQTSDPVRERTPRDSAPTVLVPSRDDVWSPEFRRIRVAGSILSLVVTTAALGVSFRAGGPVDRLLKNPQPADASNESTSSKHTVTVRPQPDLQRPPSQDVTHTTVGDVIQRYRDAVEASEDPSPLIGYPQYSLESRASNENGATTRFLTFLPDDIPISGFLDSSISAQVLDRIMSQYPQAITRWECHVTTQGESDCPFILAVNLDGRSSILNLSRRDLKTMLDLRGYSAGGYLVRDSYARRILGGKVFSDLAQMADGISRGRNPLPAGGQRVVLWVVFDKVEKQNQVFVEAGSSAIAVREGDYIVTWWKEGDGVERRIEIDHVSAVPAIRIAQLLRAVEVARGNLASEDEVGK